MSTRSLICKENADHTYTGIYCHWDGYPEHHGAILTNEYTDPKKVNDLLALGDLSCLDEEVAPPPDVAHSFDHPAVDVCVAYHRDRGEDYNPPSILNEDDINNSWAEYMYVFGLDNKWRYFDLPLDKDSEPLPIPSEFIPDGYYGESAATVNSNVEFDDILNGMSDTFTEGKGEIGVCPCCGEKLTYTAQEKDDFGIVCFWECDACGQSGKEVYKFSGHYHHSPH